eukprot:scaffold79194_cov31-Tisochrysis_lutea.AAC.2
MTVQFRLHNGGWTCAADETFVRAFVRVEQPVEQHAPPSPHRPSQPSPWPTQVGAQCESVWKLGGNGYACVRHHRSLRS